MLRPTSVTVFGILNIVFGALGIFSSLFAVVALYLQQGRPNPFMPKHPVMDGWMMIGIPLGIIFTILLIIAGVGLLLMRPWGRKLSIVYSVYAIISALIGAAMMLMFVAMPMWERMGAGENPAERAGLIGGMIGGIFGSLIGCVYPALLWYFMSRPHVLAAFAGTWPGYSTESGSAFDELPPLRYVPISNNPYAAPLTQVTPRMPSHPMTGAVSAIDTLIPSGNGAALGSYYTGIFSIMPVIGFPLAIIAILLGMKGLKNFRQNPKARGRTHSWVGLICGIVFGLFNLMVLGSIVITIVTMAARR